MLNFDLLCGKFIKWQTKSTTYKLNYANQNKNHFVKFKGAVEIGWSFEMRIRDGHFLEARMENNLGFKNTRKIAFCWCQSPVKFILELMLGLNATMISRSFLSLMRKVFRLLPAFLVSIASNTFFLDFFHSIWFFFIASWSCSNLCFIFYLWFQKKKRRNIEKITVEKKVTDLKKKQKEKKQRKKRRKQ